ncbi:MAG: chemotaxis protein CheB [Myxococcaceae bacterium]|nr:chemotaxis protein CheB [Myxococcaceae bacterium]
MTKIRVLLVEPSPQLGPRLTSLFGRKLERVGGTVTAAGLVAAVRDFEPQVVLVRVDGPSSELTRAVELVMSEFPVPMLLLAAGPGPRQAALALLAAGALDVLPMPAQLDAPALASLEKTLCLLSTVQVVKHPRGRKKRTSARLPGPRFDCPVVAIAASLGGPRALATVLSGLPRSFRAAICICQHITPGFSDDLARWLAAETGHQVVEPTDGERLEPGKVYVAPSEVHFTVSPSGTARLEKSAAVGGFLPSCDVLLKSVAASLGPRAIGVVLTGMGRDGARGLKELRARGGHTIAQDEASCVVWGMPKEAIALGAAELVLPLDRIAAQLIAWVGAR